MTSVTDFFQAAVSEQLAVPTWEMLVLLLVVSLCLLIHASRVGLLITYAFTLHITWSFIRLHFNYPILITFAVLAGIVLILGFISVIFSDD